MYGLAAAVLSQDPQRCQRVARAFQAGRQSVPLVQKLSFSTRLNLHCFFGTNIGVVWINCSQLQFVQAPWGGFKKSGIGRELGPWGLDTFLEVKQVMTSLKISSAKTSSLCAQICEWKGKQWGWYTNF